MKDALFTAAHLQMLALLGLCALSFSLAQAQTLTTREIRTLERVATTSQQFAELAHYYAQQAALFHQNAEQERAVLEEEKQHPATSTKYPQNSDRAQILRDYYKRRAEEAAHKELTYSARARESQNSIR